MDLDVSNISDDSQRILLNKSASFSGSPIAEKYEIKQLFQNKDGETYIKHYRYEIPARKKSQIQIQQLYKFTKPLKTKEKEIKQSDDYKFTPYEGGISAEFPDVKFGTPFAYFFNFAKHVPEERGFENFLSKNKDDSTPMEVDTSLNKTNEINNENLNSMLDVHYQDRENKETTHRNKVPKLMVKPNKSVDIIRVKLQKQDSMNLKKYLLFRMFRVFFIFFIPITLGLLCMFNSDTGFMQNFDSTNTIKDLRELIYGQDDIVDKLAYDLNLLKSQKIFIFTGGNGVGKTYTAQIIEKNYPYKNNIQKYIFNSNFAFDMEREILTKLNEYEQNLIIIDGLVINEVYTILPILNGLSATGKRFIVIVIFNVQEISNDLTSNTDLKMKGKEISKTFDDNNISHTLFSFDNLNSEDTKECIRYNMKSRGFKVNEKIVNQVLENVNYKQSGCKRVYAKVSLVENKLEINV